MVAIFVSGVLSMPLSLSMRPAPRKIPVMFGAGRSREWDGALENKGGVTLPFGAALSVPGGSPTLSDTQGLLSFALIPLFSKAPRRYVGGECGAGWRLV